MKVLSIKEMQELDRLSIEEYGIDSLLLMEHAALSVFHRLQEEFSIDKRPFAVFCGTGNNGGDGAAIARLLFEARADVHTFVVGDESKGSIDFQKNLTVLKKLGAVITFVNDTETVAAAMEKVKNLKKPVFVDAIFGTGLSRPIEGRRADFIMGLNSCAKSVKAEKVSVDIPSGLPASNEGACVFETDTTISIGVHKAELFAYPNIRYCGRLLTAPSIFPRAELHEKEAHTLLTDEEEMAKISFAEKRFADKKKQGMLSIVCGSAQFPGAAVMAAQAAYRSGAGYIQLLVPDSIKKYVRDKTPAECVVYGVGKKGAENFRLEDGDEILKRCEKSAALCFGCGIGRDDGMKGLCLRLIKESKARLLLDADALYFLFPADLKARDKDTVLSPHVYEFARLFSKDPQDVMKYPYSALEEASSESGASIILKDAVSFFRDAQKGITYIHNAPRSGMGKAGMGDSLAGVCSSMLARGMSVRDSALSAMLLQTRSFDRLSKFMDAGSIQPSDIADVLVGEVKKLRKMIKKLRRSNA